MLPKNVYVVWTFSNEDNNKFYARPEKIAGNNDLLSYAKNHARGNRHTGKAIHMNICNTWKSARQLAHHWNECYKENGTYSLIME